MTAVADQVAAVAGDTTAPDAPAPSEPATPTADAPAPDPITMRARLRVGEYRGSSFFRQDHPDFMLRVLAGLVFLFGCGYFALPWSMLSEPPPLDGLVSLIHYTVAWGAVPIFVMAFAAIGYARSALAEFGVNIAIAQHVERSAAARLQDIRNDRASRGSVSRLESEHLPDNPSDPKPASLRLFQRICAEAMDRRFESTINLIEPYERESMEPLLRLEGVQKSALRWGILCHFIGLVLVINAVPAMMRPAGGPQEATAQAIAAEGVPAESVNGGTSDRAINGVLDGLRLAFGASVGGLSVSLFAALLLALVRKRQFAYFRKLDEATSTMISLATNSLNNDELLSSLQHMSERLEEQTVTVKEGIQTLAAAIASQSTIIDAGLRSLGDGKLKLDQFLRDLSSSHDEFLRHLNVHYDVSTITSASARISQQIEASDERVTGLVKEEVEGVRRLISGSERAAMRLVDGLARFAPLTDGPAQFLPHAIVALGASSTVLLLVVLWRLW